MIGYYNYTVLLTYMGFISGVYGIIQATNGNITLAVICLMFSGLCDMFDGRVARTKKRDNDEVSFGVQLDSLSDLVCFGVLPSMIGYNLGMDQLYYLPLLVLFPLAGLIRLAYFNVLELKKNKFFGSESKDYIGLPITSTALFIPLLYCFKNYYSINFIHVYTIAMIIIAILFITRIKIPKLDNKELMVILIIGLIIFGFVLGG